MFNSPQEALDDLSHRMANLDEVQAEIDRSRTECEITESDRKWLDEQEREIHALRCEIRTMQEHWGLLTIPNNKKGEF